LKERIRVAELLEKVIKAFESRITKPGFKPTVAEYLKLVQLEQEAEQQDTREIKVTWIDQELKSKSEK
jgi:hypothetical protein